MSCFIQGGFSSVAYCQKIEQKKFMMMDDISDMTN